MLACANNYIFLLIQLHYLFWLYRTPIKANIILGFMALFALHYQYVEIIVCWEIKLHYCVSFSCLINNDGWLLFSSPPATILSSPCKLKWEKKEINKRWEWTTSSRTNLPHSKVLAFDQTRETPNKILLFHTKFNCHNFLHFYISSCPEMEPDWCMGSHNVLDVMYYIDETRGKLEADFLWIIHFIFQDFLL